MLAARKEEEEKRERERERKIASTCFKGRGSDPTGRNFGSRFLNCRLLSLFLFWPPPPPHNILPLFSFSFLPLQYFNDEHCTFCLSPHLQFSYSLGIPTRKSAVFLHVCSVSGPSLAVYKSQITAAPVNHTKTA